MSCLYITEHGAKIGVEGGTFVVEGIDQSKRIIPKEVLESIFIMGNSQMTTAGIKDCLYRGIPVTYLATDGKYFGKLSSTSHVNAARLKKQVYLSDDVAFCLEFSKKIIEAKINNQYILLKRYVRNVDVEIDEQLMELKRMKSHINNAETIEQIMGYEGGAAKAYFKALSGLVCPEFKFKGRSRRPPKDPFNSLLSLGYTVLLYEIYAEIESHGLNPYLGFMHKIRENHPTLASDLLEEWRAVIVDSTVMSLIQGNELDIVMFEIIQESGGVKINREGIRIFMTKLEKKMQSTMNYMEYLDHPTSFRCAIWWQTGKLAQCVEKNSLEGYAALKIR